VEELARRVESSESVAFVPALAGLGAPHWDPDARGTITGITRGTTAAHIARATLEGIAFSVWDLLAAMEKDAGAIARLRVDGGASRNSLLMQFQSDIAQIKIERPHDVESTGRGAAMLAGVGLGLVPMAGAKAMSKVERMFEPKMSVSDRDAHLAKWRDAVARTLGKRP
jgi:glycerol kinase